MTRTLAAEHVDLADDLPGVPHRDVAATVTFVAGHERTGADVSAIRWDNLGPGHGTLVFFMGLRNLAEIARHLLDAGRSRETPAAVIEWGTTEHQRTVAGTLGDIVEQVRAAGLDPPALVVVGEVVALRDRLRWEGGSPGQPRAAAGAP